MSFGYILYKFPGKDVVYLNYFVNFVVVLKQEVNNTSVNLDVIHRWNDQSLTMLYRRFYKALVVYAFQITKDLEMAEDIVQDVFSNVWQKKTTFQTVGTLKAYLYNSVRNESINSVRHQQVRQDNLKQIELHYKELHLDEHLELKLHKEEVYRQLLAAIDNLPERQRELFLHIMRGKKNAEIAEAMGISINTVKKQRQRGMEILKGALAPECFILLFNMLEN